MQTVYWRDEKNVQNHRSTERDVPSVFRYLLANIRHANIYTLGDNYRFVNNESRYLLRKMAEFVFFFCEISFDHIATRDRVKTKSEMVFRDVGDLTCYTYVTYAFFLWRHTHYREYCGWNCFQSKLHWFKDEQGQIPEGIQPIIFWR